LQYNALWCTVEEEKAWQRKFLECQEDVNAGDCSASKFLFPVIVETPFKARKYATEHHAWKQQDLLKRKPLNLTVAMNEKKFSAVIQL